MRLMDRLYYGVCLILAPKKYKDEILQEIVDEADPSEDFEAFLDALEVKDYKRAEGFYARLGFVERKVADYFLDYVA